MNTQILRNFGKSLKNFRVEKDFTQEFLAEKIAVHATYIGKLESGKSNPSLKLLFKITRALDIRLNELFEFDKK